MSNVAYQLVLESIADALVIVHGPTAMDDLTLRELDPRVTAISEHAQALRSQHAMSVSRIAAKAEELGLPLSNQELVLLMGLYGGC